MDDMEFKTYTKLVSEAELQFGECDAKLQGLREWYVRVLFELPEPDSPLRTPSVYPFHLAGIVIPTF